MNFKLLPMDRSTVPDVAAIERECFSNPWSEDMLAEELYNDNASFIVAVADDGAVSGSEVELLTDYAETIDAEVEWVPAGENTLAAMMREGQLDVVVGGLASDVPWTSEIAATRPYTTTTGPDGAEVKIVVGVQPGENALMTDIERFLAERGGEL